MRLKPLEVEQSLAGKRIVSSVSSAKLSEGKQSGFVFSPENQTFAFPIPQKPSEIIRVAEVLNAQFQLSLRDVEDLLLGRTSLSTMRPRGSGGADLVQNSHLKFVRVKRSNEVKPPVLVLR